jgi:peptide deformylase
MDQTGATHTRTFDGLSSICIQHETDHLNGIVFLDYLSKLKRDIFIKKLQKFKKS